MNQEDRTSIYKAMDILAEEPHSCSCPVLNIATTGTALMRSSLTQAYCEFYNQTNPYWSGLNYGAERHLSQNHRLMLLAWFAEVGPEGIK